MGIKALLTTDDVKTTIEFIEDQLNKGFIDFSEADGDYHNGLAVAIIRLMLNYYKSFYTPEQIIERLVATGEYGKEEL